MTKFLILSTARSGSNYLLNLLESHRNVHSYGEIFNIDRLQQDNVINIINDPLTYIDNKYDKEFNGNISAVGFKMFYDHFTSDYLKLDVNKSEVSESNIARIDKCIKFLEKEFTPELLNKQYELTWNYLRDHDQIKIIHLVRNNYLKSYVSLKRAMVTNEWLNIKNPCSEGKQIQLEIGFKECLNYFERIERQDKYYSNFFKHKAVLKISYEEIIANNKQSLEEIMKFLQLPVIELKSILKKQVVTPLEYIISNYHELKSEFSGSRWERFFIS